MPPVGGTERDCAADRVLKPRGYHMRRIELDRAALLAPALARNSRSREPGIKERAGRKDIRSFVNLFAAINFRRRVPVVENRLGLQLVVSAPAMAPGQLQTPVGPEANRLGTEVAD